MSLHCLRCLRRQWTALQDTVQRAAAFNRSLTRRAEAARVTSPAAAVLEPLPASAPAGGSSSVEQPVQPRADPEAQPDQAGAPAALMEQLPAALPAAHEGEAAAPPEGEVQSHAGEGEGEREADDDGAESRPAAGAEAPRQATELPVILEADEAYHEAASETESPEAGSHAQEPDQPSSSTALPKPQEQTETQASKQRTPSTSEQDESGTRGGAAEAPEQASTPRAAHGLIQDAPQAEQLLPALMRQVMLLAHALCACPVSEYLLAWPFRAGTPCQAAEGLTHLSLTNS